MSTHVLKVDEESSQERLDIFLATRLEDCPSRTFIKRLIDTQQVLVNGKNVKAHYKVVTNDELTVSVPDVVTLNEKIKPENIPLNIFYQDDTIVVVYKPSGMLVHPATGIYTGTLVNALLFHCCDLSNVNSVIRPGIVHRLDQDTSGLMVIAKNNIAHVNIARQFEKHRVRKKYLALVEGLVEFDEGMVDVSLGRHPKFHDKKVAAFDDEAKKAKTFYRVLKRFKTATLVALFPKTGRTHQLRVHMAYLGHPILGDEKYGKKSSFQRLALHAQGLGFFHPRTTKYLEFSCPPPEEFLNFSLRENGSLFFTK